MQLSQNKNNRRILAALVLAVGGTALAQYTPGSGGYIPPGAPVVPVPQQPSYTWEAPPAGAQPAPIQQPYGQVQPTYVQPPAAQPDPYAGAAQGAPAPVAMQLSDAQLGDLTASVALYSDPLLAQMLPAATYMEQLAYADRWLEQHPGADEAMLAQLPLEQPVKSIMHSPTLLRMMVDHLDWTQSLGLAFMYQRGDVMNAIQRWRVTALQCGTLVSTPQQQIMSQGPLILIVPPPQQPVVYVPVYDPAVVYVQRARPPQNVITFSTGGLAVQLVQNEVDWRDHEVRVPRPLVAGQVVVTESPRGVPGGTVVVPGRGGGVLVDSKVAFVREAPRGPVSYPQRIATPQPDHRVITVVAPPGRGPAGPVYAPGLAPPGVPTPPRGVGGRNPNSPPGTPF